MFTSVLQHIVTLLRLILAIVRQTFTAAVSEVVAGGMCLVLIETIRSVFRTAKVNTIKSKIKVGPGIQVSLAVCLI